jgi:hypothetical protein
VKHTLLYLFILGCLISVAQEETSSKPPELPRFSIRGNAGIPKVTSSEAFRNSFSGVITADLSINVKLFSDFFAGLGYSYTYYKPQKHFRDQFINTSMQSHNPYVKIGVDKFFSARGFATISLNAGYNFNKYSGIKYKHDSLVGKYPTQFNSSFVEPMIGLYFIVDPNFAIGGHLSYNYNFSQFNPTFSGFDKWFDYGRVENKWNMSMITLGFGFYYGLAKK